MHRLTPEEYNRVVLQAIATGRQQAMDECHAKAVSLAARLVRLPDRTPRRGDPAYDDRPEVVDREAVIDVAMELKRLGERPRNSARRGAAEGRGE